MDPSNLAATSRRYQPKMVSGLATQATWASALRHILLPISARVARSGFERRRRAGRCARKDSNLSSQVLVLKQQLVIYEPGDVGQQAPPVVFGFHSAPSS